ncbi:MAG: 3-oxoacyl-[acyl-carrier-protein] reductase [Candidatus Omnitrophota bacterium]
MDGLDKKTVIITGGSRGIGRACCAAFAKAGANVAFTYSKSKKEAEDLEVELSKLNVEYLSLQADVKDYEQCRQVVGKTIEKFGRLDVLINNAGITRDKALFMMAPEDWKEVIDTNLSGVFNMSRAVITGFLKQKSGCIINMSSVSGIIGLPRQVNYSASKAGIIGFTKSLAKEVAGYGIRVNAVCPGFIETDMVKVLKAEHRDEIIKNIPLKRMGQAQEVADLCVFIASDKAKYITAESIKIDGGLAA